MDKKILTIQDISGVGQCSLAVALPIISCFGLETCVIPTAVLSTHTAFKDFTFKDLSDDISSISDHYQKEKIYFDTIYTGYLGNKKQISLIESIFHKNIAKKGKIIVDPVMADNGKLYTGFSDDFPKEIKKLCLCADVIIPNITEACLLTNEKYKDKYDQEYIENILYKLKDAGMKNIVLTGVSFSKNKLGVATYNHITKKISYYFTKKHPLISHGTGDIFASCFCGAYSINKSLEESAALAADFTSNCVKNTLSDKKHWYGVHFEEKLPYLINKIKKLK